MNSYMRKIEKAAVVFFDNRCR